MASSRKVEFQTVDGVKLRGNLYLPKQQHAPIIIMLIGLTFLKEHVGEIPDRLREAGHAVLIYDHRNFGSSDGLPRQHINLYQQSDDISDAITFVSGQTPAIDSERISLCGGGHGGGLLMPVGATDPRVKALLIWLPFISGLWDSKAWPKGHAELIWKERIAQASGESSMKEPVYVRIFPESVEAAKQNPHSTLIGLPQAVGFHEGTKALSDAADTPWDNNSPFSPSFISGGGSRQFSYHNFIFLHYTLRPSMMSLLRVRDTWQLSR